LSRASSGICLGRAKGSLQRDRRLAPDHDVGGCTIGLALERCRARLRLSAGLLHHVSQFVAEQPVALRRAGPVAITSKMDIPAFGHRVNVAGGLGAIGMHANIRKAASERTFHSRSCGIGQSVLLVVRFGFRALEEPCELVGVTLVVLVWMADRRLFQLDLGKSALLYHMRHLMGEQAASTGRVWSIRIGGKVDIPAHCKRLGTQSLGGTGRFRPGMNMDIRE
jgi:hypothetical protein